MSLLEFSLYLRSWIILLASPDDLQIGPSVLGQVGQGLDGVESLGKRSVQIPLQALIRLLWSPLQTSNVMVI